MVDVHTLEDGGQPAEAVAERLIPWIAAASRTLDLALYDVRLPGPIGDAVADELRGAMRRGVEVGLVFNDDSPGPGPRPFEPPPPSTQRPVLEAVGILRRRLDLPSYTRLLHGRTWSTVEDPAVAAADGRNFAQLWEKGKIGHSGI